MRTLVAGLLLLICSNAIAQNAATVRGAGDTGTGMIVASGTLPDEATKAAVLKNLRKVYGADHVADQISVGGVVAPANWSTYVVDMIGPGLKNVSAGRVKIQGDTIDITGNVPNEAVRQQVLSSLSTSFDSHYRIKQHLRIDDSSKQKLLDTALANRVVQFESGSAILTAEGRGVLDEMAKAILQLDNPHIDVIGNTDNVGNRQSNIQLSLARASAVKRYLAAKGVSAADLGVSGNGPDNPIAENSTAPGRAQNRRIDFKISKSQ